MRFARMLLTTSVLALLPVSYCFGATAVRFGQLVDGDGKVTKNAIIVVDGERIVSVGTSEAAIPPNAEIIDLSKYSGIPGLINVHTHMAGPAGCAACAPPPSSAVESMFVRGQFNARRSIEMGVTTIRDLGAVSFMDIAMRNLINSGDMFGPRMFVSGPGMRPARMFLPPMATSATRPNQAPEATADSPEEARQVVNRLADAGVDVIKMFGSTGAAADVSGTQTFTFEEMKAAVEAAHKRGLKIAIHSYGFEGARDAVLAGADSLEHGPILDDATLKEMVKRGTYYDPTIDHNMNPFGKPVVVGDPIWTFGDNTQKTVRRAIKAGVKFVMGVDGAADQYVSTEIPYTRNATRELIWFVRAGMTPAQALATATVNSAALLGKEKDLGRVAPGYFADIVAVEGDPLKDIDVVVTKVRWVMKAGKVMVDQTKVSK